MKKSELRQMIREEINKLNEDKGELNNLEYKKIKSEIEKKIAKKGQHRGMFWHIGEDHRKYYYYLVEGKVVAIVYEEDFNKTELEKWRQSIIKKYKTTIDKNPVGYDLRSNK
jgi:hypothetical protein